MSRTPLSVFFFLFIASRSILAQISIQYGLVSLPSFEIFQTQSLRVDFLNSAEHDKTNILLQEDGGVDTVKRFALELPEGLLIGDVTFAQTSSNENVLSVPDNDNILISTPIAGILNVTCELSFDSLVGKVDYTLIALKKGTDEVVGRITIPFVIVGMTFFIEDPPGNITVVSGEANGYSISYEETLTTEITDSGKIRVLIQYPDGSSTDEIHRESIPHGASMQSSMFGFAGQFDHNATECDASHLGNQTQAGQIELPSGCGYGFYHDLSRKLCFGVIFEPYRAGTVTIQYSWADITSTNMQLSGEIFEFTQRISITGTPPVAVLSVSPLGRLLRPEGGEIVSLDMINANLRNVSMLQLSVEYVASPFGMLYGSYAETGAPSFTQTASFLTEPGFGTDLNWTLQYQLGSTSTTSYESAVVVPDLVHVFNYDSQSLRIDSLVPSFGLDEGGTRITIQGYFPSFDADVDGLYFSGNKLQKKYIVSVSDSEIVILSPPKSELGQSYEYLVTLRMGRAVSNSQIFSFLLQNAEVEVSQTGTSEISEDTYRVGNCTPVTFTAIVKPFTNQIQSYLWTLHLDGTGNELLQTPGFDTANTSAQTLELSPSSFSAGSYTLKVVVSLLGAELQREIHLLRQYVISIGAFILTPTERTIASPDTPLRLSAVVRPPGDCYTGNQTMMFEWSAFNEKKVFSSTDATGAPVLGNFSTTPARLGWEYVVPRESLIHGNHTIIFKVWMAADELVSGQAITQIVINEAPLVPVIRYGEEQVAVNYLSTLSLFAARSYDPDIVEGDQTAGLTYEWSCRQSTSKNFSSDASSLCNSALLPNTAGTLFSVPIAVLESESHILYLQYTLIVRKGNRVSPETALTVEVQNRGTLPFLDDYEITLTSTDGTVRDWDGVAHYERSIISVTAASAVSWTYALLEPSIPEFFSSSSLINNPIFFSADANVFTVSGNTKPLGIEAGKLSPFTTYKFKILFDGGEEHEATSVVVSLHTAEAPIVGFPVPSITDGTTNTTFTATAGIPRSNTVFSYYFILTDKDGNMFCVGGCTGHDVTHFRIGRPGTYSLSAYIFDMQGKALLDSKTLSQNITVSELAVETQYLSSLVTLFENGDDNTWTQLAHDLALTLLEPEVNSTSRMLDGFSSHLAEDLVAARMQAALEVSAGSRKIFCNSFPNSFHGSDCMSLSADLMKQSLLDTETVYNLMITVECCVENTPARTINKMGPIFPSFLDDLNRLSRTIDQGGISRRRLLQTTGEPANLLADVQTWTSRHISASVTSGQLDGFEASFSIGKENEYGQVSIVVASNPGHLPVKMVNGQQRRVVRGPSSDELFYARGTCLTKIFSASADKKRFLVLYTLDNFLLNGFQDAPQGSNLADNLYWQQVFEADENGRFVDVEIAKEDKCFCWRLPVLRKQEFLEESVEYMAGMFSVTDLKQFGVDVLTKGLAYNYVYDGVLTSEYNATEGWVEACQDQVGLVSSTLVSRTANNAVGNGTGTILGTGAAVIVGLVIGALLFVVVAMASAWIFAARAMSDVAAPLAALAPHELYVERDVYGRGTIFDVNAVTLPSAD